MVHLDQWLFQLLCIGPVKLVLGKGIDRVKTVLTYLQQSIYVGICVFFEAEGQVAETFEDVCLEFPVDALLHIVDKYFEDIDHLVDDGVLSVAGHVWDAVEGGSEELFLIDLA